MLLVLTLVLLVALGGVLALPRTGGGDLDPESARPGGARALAQVLADQGVDVRRVDSVADATAAATQGATLLVVRSTVLPPDRLEDLARTRADLVLVEPDGPVLSALAPGLAPAGVVDAGVRDAECDDPDAVAAGRALGGGRLVRATQGTGVRDGAATLCFPDDQDPAAGSYAVVGDGSRTVRVLGQGGVLTNEHLASDGNAALALRALGGQPRLVWLMASPLDTSLDEPASAVDLLPPWVWRVLLWLALLAVLAVVWRARRLGRLVEEPLPVVVRSAEAAEGRAGLYRAAGAHDRGAAVLRAAALRRLAARLGLPASAPAEQVVAQTARAAGRSHEETRAVLLGPPPADGRALVALADDIDRLTDDVLKAPAREAAHP